MLARLRRLLRLRRPRRVDAEFRRRSPELAEVIDQVHERRLSYLSIAALQDLANVVAEAETAGLPGVLVEAGTALGGSAIVLGRAKAAHRPLLLYDVFGKMPPPSESDGADVHEQYERITRGEVVGPRGGEYYGDQDDLRDVVEQNLASFGLRPATHAIRMVVGRYEETMPVTEAVAIAHVDCDWYESVKACLVGIEGSLVPGGRFIIDDYYRWSGCRTAVDEFLAGPAGRRFRPERRSRLHLVAAG